VFGYKFMHVLSGSMLPTFGPGDMIIVRLCPPESVQVGDIVAYMPNHEIIVTHRVREILTELDGEPGLWFITQGDNNATPDFEPVPAVNLVGKYVMRIPGLGFVMGRLLNRPVLALLAALLLILPAWPIAALLLWLALRKRKPTPTHANFS